MWQDEARAWLHEVLPGSADLRIEVLRDRAWGALWKVTADGGRYWFKRAHPAHLTPAERRTALVRLSAVVTRWIRLEVTVPGLSIDHNDLHAGNAFPGPRISDWGDSVIGHPFCSLRALLVPARNTFGPELVRRLRCAYLAEFVDGSGSTPEDAAALQEALDIAMMLAVPQRLSVWRAMQDPALWAEYARYIVPLWREAGTPVAQVSMP